MAKSRFIWINVPWYRVDDNGEVIEDITVRNLNIDRIDSFFGMKDEKGRMITVINCGDDRWEALHDVNEIIARIEECEQFLKGR